MKLSKRDRDVIWHPYTQIKTAGQAVALVKGQGPFLFDEQGKKYIDAVSSWWVNLHGHSHPRINAAISAQAKKLEHAMFAGFTHEPAVELAEGILKILGCKQTKAFYSDNGSTAVEVAVKMALQYWHNKGLHKKKILVLENSYHGDTFGAMAVSARSLFTQAFQELLFEVVTVPFPKDREGTETLQFLDTYLAQHRNETAAFLFEPLVLGAGGMLMYPATLLDKMIGRCRKANILAIADEVMTGFGRTGKLFASHFLRNSPDIVCLSKGITGGYMALGMTTCSQKIYEAFLSTDSHKTLYHGHSYTGNPIACAAGVASLKILTGKQCQRSIERIAKQHEAFLNVLAKKRNVRNPRQTGTLLAFDISTPEKTSYLNKIRDTAYAFFIKRGMILRPLGNTIYIMPPYCITKAELEKIYSVIAAFLRTLP